MALNYIPPLAPGESVYIDRKIRLEFLRTFIFLGGIDVPINDGLFTVRITVDHYESMPEIDGTLSNDRGPGSGQFAINGFAGNSKVDFFLGDTKIGTAGFGPLLQGNSIDISDFDLRIPNGFPWGTHKFNWKLDALEDIAESAECDNAGGNVLITIGPLPDLLPASNPAVESSSQSVLQGSLFTVSGEVQNFGLSIALPSTAVAYLSRDETISDDDHVLNSARIPQLSSFAQLLFNITGRPGNFTFDGEYFVLLLFDSENEFGEVNEDNNKFNLGTVRLGGSVNLGSGGRLPEIQTVENEEGGEFAFSFTTSNSGNISSTGHRVLFYAQHDAEVENEFDVEIAAKSILLGEYIQSEAIPPGARSTKEMNFKLKQPLEVGEYRLVVQYDVDDQVAESSENDNIAISRNTVMIDTPVGDFDLVTFSYSHNSFTSTSRLYSTCRAGVSYQLQSSNDIRAGSWSNYRDPKQGGPPAFSSGTPISTKSNRRNTSVLSRCLRLVFCFSLTMPHHDPAPDQVTIDAWLSGELPEEEARALEKYFDEHPPDGMSFDRTVGGITIDRKLAPDPQLSELIDLVKTQHAPDQPAPSVDGWKEVLTPSENPDLLGTLGSFEVLEVVATGGMGILLKARDPELNRIAAVKVLSPGLATNATARERFLREARAAAQLEHDNILPTYSVHAEAVPYFAMRYVGGGSLQDALDAGRSFSTDELKSITRQIAAALGSAHAAGIVHRDIKPGNILLDEESEQLWVCDFGIARSIEDPALTYAGGIAGTPQYMSPEQAAGDDLDGRSDLFSLGAILHRCITGENASAGTTTASVLQKLASEEQTELYGHKNKVPKWLERLLANLLAKDPRDRPHDAAVVVSAIDDEHSPRPKHTTRRNRRLAFASMAVLGVAALCIGMLQIPAVKALANRALSARFEQAFTISDKLGAYASLADAIAAADDGDTIELSATGSIAIDKLELPRDKSLTLRPAQPGTRPTLTTRIVGAPGIIATAPLHLVGLDFVLLPREASDGIVIARGSAATLKVEDCKFTSRRQVKAEDRYNETKPRCIDLIDGARAEIDACEFDLEETNAVTFLTLGIEPSTLSTLLVRDTRMSAFFGINQILSKGSRIEINVEDLIFNGQSFFKSSKLNGMAPTRCTVVDSEFNLAGPLCWIAMSDVAAARKGLYWHGMRNQYPGGLAHVRVAQSHAGKANSQLPITEYGGIRAIVSRLIPKPTKGFVEIEGSGQRYPDLASAVGAAPGGSTLLLSGTLECEGGILSRTDGIHLRPAPGARPHVVANDPAQHALFLFGKTTIRGIRFSREHDGEFALPILGLKSDGEDVLVEDCEFVVTQAGSNDGGDALSLTDVGSAIVRRCVFASQYGVGVSINFINEDSSPADVQIEDCLFIGSTAVATLSKQTGTSVRITAKHCIAVCNQLFAIQKNGRLGAIHLGFEESIVVAQQQLLYLPDIAPHDLASHLVWSGTRNHYAEDMRALHAPQSEASDNFTPTTIDTLAEFTTLFSGADETGAIEFPPVDLGGLERNITAEILREAFPQNLESPALKTLELLDRDGAG